MANALSSEDVFAPIKREDKDLKLSLRALFQMLRPAICVLLERGIKVVVVTLGSEGVFLCSKEKHELNKLNSWGNKALSFGRELYETINSSCLPNWNVSLPKCNPSFFAVHFPALPASVVRLTGAGDCLVGGTLASLCAGLDVMQSVAVGIAAAKAAVESESNVPAEYNLDKIADDARLVCSGVRLAYGASML